MSLFHKFKKTVAFTVETTVDPKFEAMRNKFARLGAMVEQLREIVTIYTKYQRGIIASRQRVTEVLHQLSGKDGSPNPIARMAAASKKVGDGIMASEEERLHKMLQDCMWKIGETEDLFKGIKARLAKRDEVMGEMDYYVAKVKDLRAEFRKYRPPPKEAERLVRNERKMDSATDNYKELNTSVYADMSYLWDKRHDLFGQIFNEFFRSERAFYIVGFDATQIISESREKVSVVPWKALFAFKEAAKVDISVALDVEPDYANVSSSPSSAASPSHKTERKRDAFSPEGGLDNHAFDSDDEGSFPSTSDMSSALPSPSPSSSSASKPHRRQPSASPSASPSPSPSHANPALKVMDMRDFINDDQPLSPQHTNQQQQYQYQQQQQHNQMVPYTGVPTTKQPQNDPFASAGFGSPFENVSDWTSTFAATSSSPAPSSSQPPLPSLPQQQKSFDPFFDAFGSSSSVPQQQQQVGFSPPFPSSSPPPYQSPSYNTQPQLPPQQQQQRSQQQQQQQQQAKQANPFDAFF